jgi:hypothetical protein
MAGKPLATQVSNQLMQLDAILKDQLSQIPAARLAYIRYESLRDDTNDVLSELARWLAEGGISQKI